MSAFTKTSATRSDRPLRTWLWTDAAACGASGALLAAASPWLPALLGYPAAFLVPVGIFLLLFGAWLGALASGRGLSPAAVRAAVAVNAVWVAASLAVAVTGAFGATVLGTAFVLAQAAAVAVIAGAEAATLRRAGLASE
ncbi:hypothetical protein [Nocardiopsis composta]|uniref:Integral membrane protein n=1 Tax=Nocardiopsis composta TaxID=157465 RepID=A0A7W8VBM0_9ACTN|nr:hypothetical protein [Nocardiopsis composta]MBB5430466.1 hypothetical protein [Nocardiopsis composta]